MESGSRVVRIGMIGCGRGAEVHHLPVLSRLPEFEVLAAADINDKALRNVADRFRIRRRFADYRELIDSVEIDAVAIATPTASHCEIGVASLRAGKHIFMEKPLAVSLDECDRLISAAASSGRKAVVALNSRWHKLVLRARQLIHSGALGELKAIRSVYTHHHPGETAQAWHKQRALGGGVIINDGVHHFDLWRFLLGAEAVEIYAESSRSPHFEDDTCSISARFDSGVLAGGIFSFSTGANSELEIFGKSARVLLALYRFDGLEVWPNTAYPGSVKTRVFSAAHTLRELPQALGAISRGGYFDLSYESLWRHFADCVLRGAQPGCTLADGRKALQIALAAVQSADSRKPALLR